MAEGVAELPRAVAKLQALVRIPTVSHREAERVDVAAFDDLVAELAQQFPLLHERLRVKPGITGSWQVSGRSSASFEDYQRLDLYYVDNWSLVTDLLIVLKTVPAVLFSRGAH